ncbi:hypothetical protein IYY11_12790 [Methylocystis sp. H62]|uniref:hypothetical protein n=1 Tax=Methylocystis sp. H62 TaxID=2785789 RepID=UPI0018C242AA|nr:hypothetical protein [Methylocystis sp. H62]MBG0794238.1 hypothetical protein [Methylocystis sp. H62]
MVPGFWLGDYNVYREMIIAPARSVIKQPKSLSFEEWASFWIMFPNRLWPLIEEAKIQPGEPLLISAPSSWRT